VNKTKWLEISKAFWSLETSDLSEENRMVIPWMTCTTDGFVYGWDETWSHFWSEGDTGKEIDRLKIKLTPENRTTVLAILKSIHVPGEVTEQEVTVYGYRTDVDYL
jgi:hypothetical protein